MTVLEIFGWALLAAYLLSVLAYAHEIYLVLCCGWTSDDSDLSDAVRGTFDAVPSRAVGALVIVLAVCVAPVVVPVWRLMDWWEARKK